MPELPEVETVARGLSYLAGQRLDELRLHDARVWFEGEGGPALLHGLRLREVSRRGKYLLLRFEGFTLVQHLRMTGKMLRAESALVPDGVREALPSKRGKALQVRCAFHFESAVIWFFDTRRFGTLTLVRDEEVFFAAKNIAPDPLLTPEAARGHFGRRLKLTKKSVKAALLDQALVAGVGIYADEALFAARIHPLTPARRVREPGKLWEKILRILSDSIAQGGSTIRDYVSAEGARGAFVDQHFVYNRAGEPCRVCGAEIRRIVVAGRSTHFCPVCQPRAPAKARRAKSGPPKGRKTAGKARPRRPR